MSDPRVHDADKKRSFGVGGAGNISAVESSLFTRAPSADPLSPRTGKAEDAKIHDSELYYGSNGKYTSSVVQGMNS